VPLILNSVATGVVATLVFAVVLAEVLALEAGLFLVAPWARPD